MDEMMNEKEFVDKFICAMNAFNVHIAYNFDRKIFDELLSEREDPIEEIGDYEKALDYASK